MWFTIAAVAAVVGLLLLAADHGRRTAHRRERRRWAALRGWRFVESDPVLPSHWHHGVIAHGGAGSAEDLVIGRLFTSRGRRPVQVFDHEQGGKVSGVVVAVQRRRAADDVVVELWLPNVPFPRDAGLELLGPVGERYAFVTDLAKARPLITPDLVDATAALGDDIPVAWLEQDSVLASAPATATPARLERLLRGLGEIVDQLDGSADEADHAEPPPPAPRNGADTPDRSTSG